MGLKKILGWGMKKVAPSSDKVDYIVGAAKAVMDSPIKDCSHSLTPGDISHRVRSMLRPQHDNCTCTEMYASIEKGFDLFMGLNDRSREIPGKTYIEQYVSANDRSEIRSLVEMMASRYKERGVDPTILAVGSSTFPMIYWAALENRNEEQKSLRYNDIDLFVSPKEQMPPSELSDLTKNILSSEGFECEQKTITRMGSSRHFLHLAYDTHSLTTQLKNGLGVDFIFGKNGTCTDANQKIRKEREDNNPFSILYQPEG